MCIFQLHAFFLNFLSPITQFPGGKVAKLATNLAAEKKVTPDQVLMAWAKAKGAIVVTYVFRYVDWKVGLTFSQNQLQEVEIARISACRRFEQVFP